MTDTTEPAYIFLVHGIEYLIDHPHQPIIYPRNNIFILNQIPYQCFLRQILQKNKIRNTPTYFTHNAEYIMQEIYLKVITLPQQISASMEQSYTGVPVNSPIHPKAVSIHKQ